MKYAVNVRASMRGSKDDTVSVSDSPWIIYDTDTYDGADVILCDTRVEVEAKSPMHAIEKAKDAAPLVELDGILIDRVRLWVDEKIDVEEVLPTPILEIMGFEFPIRLYQPSPGSFHVKYGVGGTEKCDYDCAARMLGDAIMASLERTHSLDFAAPKPTKTLSG